MNTKRAPVQNVPVALDWVRPLPAWSPMLQGGRVLIQTYTLENVGHRPITIQSIGLIPGGDSRLRITGGTCNKGVVLAPRSSVTIHVEMDPRTLGQVAQCLQVQYSGSDMPLRSPISFPVTETLARPSTQSKQSYLVDETDSMDRMRRQAEQDGHRRLARVHAREHNPEQQQQPAPEGELQNSILQNPWLDSQRFDGVDTNLNPEPPLNTEARREFDNERREQEMEKQLRLGNMPAFTTAPRPEGPR